MTTPLTRSDSFIAHAQRLLNSGCGVIIVRTTEPFRARSSIRTLSAALAQPCWHWDMIRGWYDSNEATKKTIANTQGGPTPFVAMAGNEMPAHTVGVMLWPHPILKQVPPAVHQLAILCDALPVKTIKQGNEEIPDRRCLFLLTPPEFDIPNEVRDMIPILDFSVPDREELRAVLSDSLASAESNGRVPSFSKEDTDTILSVAAGLTELEAETAFSLALVTHATQLPNIKVDDFCAVVSEAKVDAVKRSDVLEIMPAGSPDDIGGLENLKQWVAETAVCLSEEAREAGIDQPKGVFLAGPPGCLSGDTVIHYRRGKRNSSRPIPLKALYEKFNGLAKKDRWDINMPTQLHSWDCENGVVGYNTVVSVIEAGVKPCVRVTTTQGDSITLTPDHPIAVPVGGFSPPSALSAGDTILMRGDMKPRYTGGKKLDARPERVTVNVKYHPFGGIKVVDGYNYTRVHRARLVIEALINQVSYEQYVHDLKTDPHSFIKYRFMPSEFECHHIDGDTLNDTPSNIMVCTKAEHAREHGANENFNVEYTRVAVIQSVESVGDVMTYDVQMALPHDNFVADGFIVHNTGKSASAKAIAGVLRLPLIKFDVSRVFSSLVGSSEQRVKSCLKLIESMAPCVALVDEVDKVFNVNSGGGDSGVGARVLGTMLTFMQESKAGVFWVVTANRVSGLPPELLRKGRLDETFAVTVPNEEERMAVLGIHLRKRKHDPDTIEKLDHAAAASNGFVPAELEAAVNEALKYSFVHKVPVTGGLILEQLSQMKPLSEAFAEQFKEMEEWADNNARPASAARAAAARPARVVPARDGAAPAPTGRRVRQLRNQG